MATVFFECRLPRLGGMLGGESGPLDQHLAAGSIIVAAKSSEGASAAWAAKASATEAQEAL